MRILRNKWLSVLVVLAVLFNSFPLQTVLAAPGDLDSNFNYGANKGSNGTVFGIAINPSGSIYIGGSFTSYNGVAVPRGVLLLDSFGVADAAFIANAGTGVAGALVGGVERATVNTIVRQADGKILVGGNFTTFNGVSAPRGIVRLNADGTRDAADIFNVNAGTGVNGYVYSIVLQPDGNILLGGSFTSYNADLAAPNNILRIKADGSLDTGFNYNKVGANSVVQSIALQSDNKIIVGGSFRAYNGTNSPDFLLRVDAVGALDATFNPGGSGLSDGVGFGDVRALGVAPDDSIYVGGYFSQYNSDTSISDNIFHVDKDGSLDATFNPAGSGPFISGYHAVNSLVLQPDGKIVLGGYFSDYNGAAAAPDHVLRVNSDGSLDATFNNGASNGTDAEVSALLLQPDGRLLIGGAFTTYNADANAPDSILRLSDALPLTVTINQAAGQADPTNAAPINFTVLFSAPVSGFGDLAADISLSGTAGGTLSAVVTEIAPNDGSAYNVAVSGMNSAGTVIADIPAGAAMAASKVGNLASSSVDHGVTYVTSPTVTVNQASGQADPTSSSPIHFTVLFSRPVSGFGDLAGDVALSGTAAGALSAVVSESAPNDGSAYTVAVSGMTSSGTVIVDVPAGAALDTNGFANLASTSSDHSVTFSIPSVLASVKTLPDTGFSQRARTSLPAQPADKAYRTYSDLQLNIPVLGVSLPIVGVPLISAGWDVSWLDGSAGWLNGSAFPTWAGNSVITAHVWDANNQPGPFVNLKTLRYGDQIRVQAWGQRYTYVVRQNIVLYPSQTNLALVHEDSAWITLLTCEDYSLLRDTYSYRRMVRAVLVDVTDLP